MGRKYATFGEMIRVLPSIGIGIIAALAVFRLKQNKLIIFIAIFFLSSLLFAYARFDFIHLQPALPLALLLITFVGTKLPKPLIFPIAFIYLCSVLFIWGRFLTQLPVQQTHFFTSFEQRLTEEIDKQVPDGETIFAMATTPHIYYLTDTLPPGKQFVFQFHWFMVEAEDEILAGIVQDPPKIVIRDPHAKVAGENLVEYMPNINAYVNEHYAVYTVIDGTELLRPK
jgi:hypothetical protein